MSDERTTDRREQQVNRILAEYLEAQRLGRAQDPEDLLRQYPELAVDLQSFFADRNQFGQMADQLGPIAGPAPTLGAAPTLAPDAAAEAGPALSTVRYFGDYELLEEIARGGMGVVYKARQVSLNRLVALKMILTGQLASTQDVQRFHTEAEAAANLDHPNIVPIHEVGEHEGQHYFSMKLIAGSSLAQELGVRSQEPGVSRERERWAAEIVAAVARAVHHAHQRGVLHRDLKPGNILLDADGQPHVTDFGLARRVADGARQTRTGDIVGTPSYMPPEQARGEKGLTIGVDVYSLGAILYELLAGRPPFRAETPLETVMQVLEREPEPPSKFAPHIDRDLETICLKCLEKEPGQRYGSAEALAADLQNWLRGEPIRARPSTALERAKKWILRQRAVTGSLSVAVIASMVAVMALIGANAIISVLLLAVCWLGVALYILHQASLRRDVKEKGEMTSRVSPDRIFSFRFSIVFVALMGASFAGTILWRQERADFEHFTGIWCTVILIGALIGALLGAILRAYPQLVLPLVVCLMAFWCFSVPFSILALYDWAVVRYFSWPLFAIILCVTIAMIVMALRPMDERMAGIIARLVIGLVGSSAVVSGVLGAAVFMAISFREIGNALIGVVGMQIGQPLGLLLGGVLGWVVGFGRLRLRNGRLLLLGMTNVSILWFILADPLKGSPPSRVEHLSTLNLPITWSPDGRLALLHDRDGAIPLWDVRAGKVERYMEGRTQEISSFAIWSDGSKVLAGSKDGIVRLWNVATGRELRRFTSDDVRQLAVSPDGRWALADSKINATLELLTRLPPVPHATAAVGSEQNRIKI
jgi:hypothetical protein